MGRLIPAGVLSDFAFWRTSSPVLRLLRAGVLADLGFLARMIRPGVLVAFGLWRA